MNDVSWSDDVVPDTGVCATCDAVDAGDAGADADAPVVGDDADVPVQTADTAVAEDAGETDATASGDDADVAMDAGEADTTLEDTDSDSLDADAGLPEDADALPEDTSPADTTTGPADTTTSPADTTTADTTQDTTPACQDECAVDATECVDGQLRTCGDFDGDPCREWSPLAACPTGLVCDPDTDTCREPCGDFCDPFSVILLPDTQNYTNLQPNNASNTYRKQTKWVVDHRDSHAIQFVIHLGDITNNNTPEQWEVADAAHALLDAAGVPYSVTTGNHDYDRGDGLDRGSSLFNDYFGPSRFAGRPWYGGSIGSSNVNNYAFFEVGPMKFMVLSIEYAPRKQTLCWAEEMIAAHPDHRVIIATHCYIGRSGAYITSCPTDDYNTVGADGATIWEELASRHSNVFLVVAGHTGASKHKTTTGNTGNTVHELVVDYQFEGPCAASTAAACTNNCRAGGHTGNGWMRELVFDPRTNRVAGHTFTVEDGNTSLFPGGHPTFFCSPLFAPPDPDASGGNYYPSDPTASAHEFSFAYDMAAAPQGLSDDLGDHAFLDQVINGVGAGNQLRPRVAMDGTGRFVAVWEDDSSSADGAGNHDIRARGFAPGGCVDDPDFTVNPDTDGQQQTPSVAMDAAGNYVVTWADDKDGNGAFQIYARGFYDDGTQRFPRFTVNSAATGQQLHPVVGMAPDGRFVVAWEDDPERDGTYQVLMRGFNADGTERFSDRNARSTTDGDARRPAVALDDAGNFVVAWEDDTDGNGGYQIHARGFSANGAQRFARLTVNSVAKGQQREPTLGLAGNGDFVVAWEDDPESDGHSVILARAFHANGSEKVADFTVSAATGVQVDPEVSVAPSGAFVLTWAADFDDNGVFQIHARGYAASGAQLLPRWTVNRDASGAQDRPHVALNDDGTMVFVWEDDIDGNGYTQILGRGL
ncbi:MAG: hypothetical protein EP329_09990 [Deltaproteobacteria bacterium]|nr:MAG: hypothetical protein EP329_09990 [Deltaproteobacteria bacterium]